MRSLFFLVAVILFCGDLCASPSPQKQFDQIQTLRFRNLDLWRTQSYDFIRAHPSSRFSRFLLRQLYDEFQDDGGLHAFTKEIAFLPKHQANRVAIHYLAFYQVEGWRSLAEEIVRHQPDSRASSLALCRLATVNDPAWISLARFVLEQPSHRAVSVACSRLSTLIGCQEALMDLVDDPDAQSDR
jgi:hypothetical protein